MRGASASPPHRIALPVGTRCRDCSGPRHLRGAAPLPSQVHAALVCLDSTTPHSAASRRTRSAGVAQATAEARPPVPRNFRCRRSQRVCPAQSPTGQQVADSLVQRSSACTFFRCRNCMDHCAWISFRHGRHGLLRLGDDSARRHSQLGPTKRHELTANPTAQTAPAAPRWPAVRPVTVRSWRAHRHHRAGSRLRPDR